MKPLSYDEIAPLMQEMIDSGRDVEFVPRGVSMQPIFRSGKHRIVLTKPQFPLKKYDIPFYRRPDGRYVLHRIIAVREGGYMCCGDGQITKEYPVLDDWIIGVVKGYYTKKGKYVDIHSFWVSLYARLRVLSRPLRALPKRIARAFKKK